MENPRPEKVAVVAEVKAKLGAADAVVLTDYRGINVAAMSELRRALRLAGGEYKIYKNSLVRFAARELDLELDELLLGPTAIAFIPRKGDGTPGDPVMVAKALRDFARTNEYLVVKGGLLGDKLLSVADVKALAEVAPREELLARLAGGFAAPMQRFAGLLAAIPRNFAYGLAALIEQQGGVPDTPVPDTPVVDEAPEAESAPVQDVAAPVDTAVDPAVADEAGTPAAEDEAAPPEATAEAGDAESADPAPRASDTPEETEQPEPAEPAEEATD